MAEHYSHPKGFVGRNICYAIYYNDVYYGHIVGGSATMYLSGRDEFFDIDKSQLNGIVNNIFFNISPPPDGKYPIRNFTTKVVRAFREQIILDWESKYGDVVMGFETLVEPPRTGELYLRDGWMHVGTTRGLTCKRVAGPIDETEKYRGVRVWTYDNLRPKYVLCRWR